MVLARSVEADLLIAAHVQRRAIWQRELTLQRAGVRGAIRHAHR